MKTKKRISQYIAGLLLSCISVTGSGCGTFHSPGQTITLQKAVTDSVEALEIAARAAKENRSSWGLKPAEVTLTYNISNELDNEQKLKLDASYPPVTIGGEIGLSKKTQTGNTVVLRFTQNGVK